MTLDDIRCHTQPKKINNIAVADPPEAMNPGSEMIYLREEDPTPGLAHSQYAVDHAQIKNDRTLTEAQKRYAIDLLEHDYRAYMLDYAKEITVAKNSLIGRRVVTFRDKGLDDYDHYSDYWQGYIAHGVIEVLSIENPWIGFQRRTPPLGTLVVRTHRGKNPKSKFSIHAKLFSSDGISKWTLAPLDT